MEETFWYSCGLQDLSAFQNHSKAILAKDAGNLVFERELLEVSMYKIEISMSCNRQQRDELVSAMNTKKINYIKNVSN